MAWASIHSKAVVLLLFIVLLIDFPIVRFGSQTYRGSYMSAHVLVNLLKSLLKRENLLGKPSILSLFRNEFNKFNSARARMLDSFYHMH